MAWRSCVRTSSTTPVRNLTASVDDGAPPSPLQPERHIVADQCHRAPRLSAPLGSETPLQLRPLQGLIAVSGRPVPVPVRGQVHVSHHGAASGQLEGQHALEAGARGQGEAEERPAGALGRRASEGHIPDRPQRHLGERDHAPDRPARRPDPQGGEGERRQSSSDEGQQARRSHLLEVHDIHLRLLETTAELGRPLLRRPQRVRQPAADVHRCHPDDRRIAAHPVPFPCTLPPGARHRP